MDVARCLYLAGGEEMRILSKTISFVSFVFSIILTSLILNPHLELYDDRIFMAVLIVVGLFCVRLFLIPRFVKKEKEPTSNKTTRIRRLENKKLSRINLIIYVLIAVQIAFCLAGIICGILISYFEYEGSTLERYGWAMYSISMTVCAIWTFISSS